MPIPTPNNGESREDFMNRCISFIIDEGSSQDQAIAICNQQWSDNKISNAKQINISKMNLNKDILK